VRFINYANLLENSSDDVPIPYDYITEYNNFFNNDIPTNTNTNITNTASVINAIHAVSNFYYFKNVLNNFKNYLIK
jgi:hypothetical protein